MSVITNYATEGIEVERTDEATVTHVPVLLNEVCTYLNLKSGQTIVDGTLGLGGHAKAILDTIGINGRLIGIDKDAQSLYSVKNSLGDRSNQCDLIRDDFRNIDKILETLQCKFVDGILLDLGVSSAQLDNPLRGFSLLADGPLDMRMDSDGPICAYDLVNSLSENEISDIIKNFGQDRWFHRIARQIVRHRSQQPIETTRELRHVIMKAIPFGRKRQKIHPATRTFQAFRIAVNRELESLEEALGKCVNALKVGGRIAVISFHSLEDRIVKEQFRNLEKEGKIKHILKKPLRPMEKEICDNPRSRSARLRVAERA